MLRQPCGSTLKKREKKSDSFKVFLAVHRRSNRAPPVDSSFGYRWLSTLVDNAYNALPHSVSTNNYRWASNPAGISHSTLMHTLKVEKCLSEISGPWSLANA